MKCPHCGALDNSRVLDTRHHAGDTYRRRKCGDCDKTFFSQEIFCRRMPQGVIDASLARIRRKKTPPPPIPWARTRVTLNWTQPHAQE